MKILGIEHIAIAVDSLEKGSKFWKDIMGLEFKKQEERIDTFYKEAEEAHQNWIKNKTTINEYWTGLS